MKQFIVSKLGKMDGLNSWLPIFGTVSDMDIMIIHMKYKQEVNLIFLNNQPQISMTNIFSTSVYTGLFAYLFERNWHYFMVGVTVLAIFGLYYHITHHDETSGNTLKGYHGIDYDKVTILLARFYLASVFLIMGGLHGAFNIVPTAAVEIST